MKLLKYILTTIFIDINKKKDFLKIKVQNSGNLNKSQRLEEHLGVGLENVRRRLELIYSGKAELKITEVKNNVLASIKIPVA